jgi:hypothetical protein
MVSVNMVWNAAILTRYSSSGMTRHNYRLGFSDRILTNRTTIGNVAKEPKVFVLRYCLDVACGGSSHAARILEGVRHITGLWIYHGRFKRQ